MGATRSGKTHVTLDLVVKRAMALPEGNCLLIGKTYKTLMQNVILPLRQRFGSFIVGPQGRLHEVTIFGRPFYCVSANDESSYRTIQGMTAIYACCDEFALYPESFVEMLRSRLSLPGACCDMTLNPEGPNHWFKRRWLDANLPGMQVWHFTIDDNPFLDPEFVAALKREYTGVWYRRMILGEWAVAAGAVYDMLDVERHCVRNLPTMHNYYIGLDYGPASVTTAVLVGHGIDNRLYIVDRWRHDALRAGKQLTDPDVIHALDAWLERLAIDVDTIVIPQDAQSLGLLLAQDLRQLRHIRRMSWADQSAESVRRGIMAISSLLATDRLKFSRRLYESGGMEEWFGYSWDPRAQELGEDKVIKQDDHDPDAARYVIEHLRPIWQRWLRHASGSQSISDQS